MGKCNYCDQTTSRSFLVCNICRTKLRQVSSEQLGFNSNNILKIRHRYKNYLLLEEVSPYLYESQGFFLLKMLSINRFKTKKPALQLLKERGDTEQTN